ncbi:MAG: AMP-binding protein, partial [Lachnospiraceae bacterium]|nr:AMP-binding protein [Lachnospiraceae bacterium]
MALQKRLPEPLSRAFSRIAFRELRENIFGDSIRFLITGGSFIDPKVLAFFNGIGYRLANGYGMTEIGITSVELSPKRRWLCGGYVGAPMTHAEYRVDENGELLVRGKVLARYILDGGTRRER